MNKANRSRKIVKHTVYVTNIPKDIDEPKLFDLFESQLSSDASKAVYKTIIVRDVTTGESRGYGRVIFRNAKATLAAIDGREWEIGGKHLYVERVPNEEESENSENDINVGLYDFFPSPKKPRIAPFRFPESVANKILKTVKGFSNGCPIGELPNLIDELDYEKYGFRNLTQAIRSVHGIRLDKRHHVHLDI
jgi:RNA recognition motif-containing protein